MTQKAGDTSGIRRRLQGSCDHCRRKKTRCDSAEMPGKWCTNCLSLQLECTHGRSKGGPANTRPTLSPPSPAADTAQEHIAAILSTTIVYIPSNDPVVSQQILVKISRYARELEETVASLRQELAMRPSNTAGSTTPEYLVLTSTSGDENHDHDSGSIGRQFLRTTLKRMHRNISHLLGHQRLQRWAPHPLMHMIQSPHQIFPEEDLLKNLVNLYFEQINPVLGFLHAPSFKQSVSDDLHHRDPYFGAVLLAVCALGSRYSDDPRVFLPEATSGHSCGWKWLRQLIPINPQFSPEHSLHQMQAICLFIQYIVATGVSTRSDGRDLAALALRFAHEAGVTRRSGYTFSDPLTAELYKRVVWVLIITDTIMSSLKGEPSVKAPAIVDLDLPTQDESWGVPGAGQTWGKPSSDAFLPVYTQLMKIFGQIQGAVYPVNGQICSEEVVVELDSALNKWLDVVPEHLKWDQHQGNQVFLAQSAVLYSTYYHAQILIHRPFIPTPGKESVHDNFPSLAICANAARSCAHVLDIQTRRAPPLHNAHIVNSLFDSAVVLLVNVWAVVRGRKSRGPDDFKLATADVQNCLRVLRLYEKRWRTAGNNCEIIAAMLKFGHSEPPLAPPIPPKDGDASPLPPASLDTFSNPQLSAESSNSHFQQLQEIPADLFSLPFSTDELGRLPIYDSFDPQFTYNATHYRAEMESDPTQTRVFAGDNPIIDSMLNGVAQEVLKYSLIKICSRTLSK
ncbi:fungal-specific transcription factor domain-containing protein [Mycena metata]|uniref:Fungal-specific transcription factor domain-containing protein n=1 Tax=Mycena metata TaxID=1033252 RepID=A0AAD7HYE0_9AGAR|nr:fungal-specific transcription factor domain-containing protein [Mycena metata]